MSTDEEMHWTLVSYAILGGIVFGLSLMGVGVYAIQRLGGQKVVTLIEITGISDTPVYVQKISPDTYSLTAASVHATAKVQIPIDLAYGQCYKLTFSENIISKTVTINSEQVANSFCQI